MGRKAKEHIFYNNTGETFVGTIPELMEEHGVKDRTDLYKSQGSTDAQEQKWRIGAEPVIKKVRMGTGQQAMFNIFERSVQHWRKTGETLGTLSINELRAAIASYQRNLYILEYQSVDGNSNISEVKERVKRKKAKKEYLSAPYK